MRMKDILESKPIVESHPAYLTVYRGEYGGNKGGNFWTDDREFARQFTQSGQDKEILVRYIASADIYMKSSTTYAGNEHGFDAAFEAAKEQGFKAFMLSEGVGEPNSIFVFDKSALKRTPPKNVIAIADK